METILSAGIPADVRVDLLVMATGRDWKAGEVARLDQRVRGKLIAEVRRQGFHGAEGEVAVFQTHGTLAARHVLLCGVEPAASAESWYKLADAVVARARELN